MRALVAACVAAAGAVLAVTGCAADTAGAGQPADPAGRAFGDNAAQAPEDSAAQIPEDPAAQIPEYRAARAPDDPAAQAPERSRERRPPAEPARPRMLRSTLAVPAIGLATVAVVPYRGSPDDGPGTAIQDTGIAASPFGGRGGVGPGQVGNYIVTAHRTTEPAPFAELTKLRRGQHVLVTAAGRVHDYRVIGTRTTSFRSPVSLARQSAAVPGHPGRVATAAMITLSTCATPEDHARGNYWADEFGNPEHRIDKIGVLVDSQRTGREQ